MEGSCNCPQPCPGLQLVLVRQQGAEALVGQKEGGPLDGKAGQGTVVASGKGPDGELACHPGV